MKNLTALILLIFLLLPLAVHSQERTPVRIELSPKTITLSRVGGYTNVKAMVLDQHGDAMADLKVQFLPVIPTCVRVSAGGRVTGVAQGKCGVNAILAIGETVIYSSCPVVVTVK